MAESKTHFPTLNAIRFLTAISVMTAHIPIMAGFFGVPLYEFPFLKYRLVGSTVTLFFVLSGFLVTHSLLRASKSGVAFDYKRYYIGRFMRIAPQYFTAGLICALLFPVTVTPSVLILFSLNFTNFARAFLPMSPLNHLWSISIEEQYLAALPLLIRVVKYLPLLFLQLFVARIIIVLFASTLVPDTPVYNVLMYYRWEGLIIGGLAAYIYVKRAPILRWIHKYDRLIAVVFFLNIVFNDARPLQNSAVLHFLSCTLSALVVALFILNVATHPKPLVRLEGARWDALARASYGIFAHHTWIIYVITRFYQPAGLSQSLPYTLNVYALVYAASIGVGWLSNRLIEQPMIRLRTWLMNPQPVQHEQGRWQIGRMVRLLVQREEYLPESRLVVTFQIETRTPPQ